MEYLLTVIIEFMEKYFPSLYSAITGDKRIVYLTIFTVLAIIILLLAILLFVTLFNSKNIINFTKYRSDCNSEVKKDKKNSYYYDNKGAFFKKIIISMIVIIVSIACVIFFSLKVGHAIQMIVNNFTLYIILTFASTLITIVIYSLLIYWIALLSFKINEKFIYMIRPSIKIKKVKKTRRN